GGRRPGYARINQVLLSLRRKLAATRGGAQVEIAAVGYRYRRKRFLPVLVAFDGANTALRAPTMAMRPPLDNVGREGMIGMIPTSHHSSGGRGPWQRKIVCQFDPADAEGGGLAEGASVLGAPSAFSPWVVTDFGYQPAALLGAMGVTRDFRGWSVELSQVREG